MSGKHLKNNVYPAQQEQKTTLSHHAKRIGAKAVLASMFVIPVADYATSDVISAKALSVTQEVVHTGSKAGDTAAVDGIIALAIVAQCVAMAEGLTKSKKLAGLSGEFETYVAEREATMSAPRRAVSKVLNAPYAGISKLGSGAEKLGNAIAEKTDSRVVASLGRLVVDAGMVNAIGPPMKAMQETMDGHKPSLGRNVRLGSLFAGTWVGLAEGIRQVYRNVSPARPSMAFVGHAFETMTTMDVTSPLSTPIGTGVLSSVAFGLGYTGWKLADRHMAGESAEPAATTDVLFPNELLPFPPANPGSPLFEAFPES